MMKPTIHMNGTGADELFRQNVETVCAVRNAIEKLSDAAPHGRDYYPQDRAVCWGSPALSQAIAEHADRVQKLKDVLKEIEEICEHISNERDRRG